MVMNDLISDHMDAINKIPSAYRDEKSTFAYLFRYLDFCARPFRPVIYSTVLDGLCT